MKYKKLAIGLVVAFVVYLGVAWLGLSQLGTRAVAGRYVKTSVDDTPLFIYTDTTNGCRFVYDAISRTVRVAQGSERCTAPTTLE